MENFKAEVEGIKAQMQAGVEAKKEAAEAKGKAEAAERKIDEVKTEIDGKLEKIAEGVNKINKDVEGLKLEAKEHEGKGETLEQSLESVFKSDEFKSVLEAKAFGNNGREYELKVATTDVVAPIHTTLALGGQIFPTLRQPTLLGRLTGRGVPAKGKIAWLNGTHTSGVGYVGEGVNTTVSDTIAVTERSRAMAKISAHMKVTTEMLEDTPMIAGQLQTQLTSKAALFADKEMFAGDGNDATQPNHFYGLQGVAVAFDATKAGVATSVENPNIGDIVDAMCLQANIIDAADPAMVDVGGYVCDWVFMHPSLVYLLSRTKDKNGQYVVNRLIDGTMVMGGLTVIPTTRIDPKAILTVDSSVIEFYIKRNMELKVAQIDKDALNDMFTLILFFRAQMLVRNDNNRGVIYCPDYTAAITALAKV